MNAPLPPKLHAVDAAFVMRRAERLPRYTSYPTANHFRGDITPDLYRSWLGEMPEHAAMSLYLHIPFCESMCWYCACSTKATKRYAPVAKYLETLKAEIETVSGLIPTSHRLTHLHWGGGSPDILVPDDIRRLGGWLRERFNLTPDTEFAIEVDPRLMTAEKADALVEIGVNRISIGVQDFDEQVQAGIGRMQSYAVSKAAVDMFRKRGVGSINMDLVYGLPYQTEDTMLRTIDRVLSLAPDRIAIFGYAHLPQRAHNQRLINEAALPGAMDRYTMSNSLIQVLHEAGYVQRGIDHFARADDSLATEPLNRNFQGYTTDAADYLIGLGATSIGKMPQGYVQNAVAVGDYTTRIETQGLATAKGHVMTDDDRLRAFVIERIMCDFAFSSDAVRTAFGEAGETVIAQAFETLADDTDGILEATADGFRLTPLGRPFVRSICARFDAHLNPEPGVTRHSMAI